MNNNTNYKSKLNIKFYDDNSLTITTKIPSIYYSFENFEIIFGEITKNILEKYTNLRT